MPSRLAQHLVQKGLLPVEKAQEAVRQLALTGGGFDTVLLEQGGLSEGALLAALGEVANAKPVQLADFEPNLEVAPLIPPKIADRLCVVPLSVDGSILHVACSYPLPRKELDEIAFLLGKQLELWVALEVRIRDWIHALYKAPLPVRYASLLAALDPNRRPPAPPPKLEPVAPKQAPGYVEETTLEDALTRDMVDRIARAVAEEPIPLDVVKRPSRPPEAPPAPARPAAQVAPPPPPAAAMAPSRATPPPPPAAALTPPRAGRETADAAPEGRARAADARDPRLADGAAARRRRSPRGRSPRRRSRRAAAPRRRSCPRPPRCAAPTSPRPIARRSPSGRSSRRARRSSRRPTTAIRSSTSR